MSGEKYIRIASERLRALMRDSSALQSLEVDYSQLQQQYDASQQEFEGRYGQLLNRQSAFESQLVNMGQDIRRYEMETDRRIRQMDSDLRQEISNMGYALRTEFNQRLEEQNRRLTNMIQHEKAERQRQFMDLQQQISTLVVDKARKQEAAASWVQHAQDYFSFVEQYYRHAFFAPGEMAKIQRSIEQAAKNLQQGFSDAALTAAQEKFFELSELRIELEMKEREWETARYAALESARRVLEMARSNRKVEAIDVEGNKTGVEIEADYYTEGKLSRLHEKIEKQVKELESNAEDMTTEALKRVAEEAAPAYKEELEVIIQEARLAVINSQMRVSIADAVVHSLEKQGFAIQDATYEGEDFRRSYVAKVAMIDGAEVVVRVSPTESHENELEIHSFDQHQVSEHELHIRSQKVAAHLQDLGLDATKPKEMGTGPNESLRDIAALRTQRRQVGT